MPRLAAMAFILLAAGGESQAAESSLLGRCRQLFASPGFDCECIAKHLDPRLRFVEVEIALAAWSYSQRDPAGANRGFKVLYRQHSVSEVNRALFHFHLTRIELLMKCPQAGPEGEDDY